MVCLRNIGVGTPHNGDIEDDDDDDDDNNNNNNNSISLITKHPAGMLKHPNLKRNSVRIGQKELHPSYLCASSLVVYFIFSLCQITF
jgi:hypothetical protein